MKYARFFVAAMAMLLVCSAALKAAEGDVPAVPGTVPGTAKTPAGEWSGTVGCMHCNFEAATKAKDCAAALKVGEVVYCLKASEKADEATKAKVTKYKTELKGDFTVKGTLVEEKGVKWVVADSITAKAQDAPAPK